MRRSDVDVIEINSVRCTKMTKGLFYNLDSCLAIVIRDTLKEFANKHIEGFPGYYENDPRLDGEDKIGSDKFEEKASKLWRDDVLTVADEFDRYLKEGEKMTGEEIDEMFAALAFIFPSLWT